MASDLDNKLIALTAELIDDEEQEEQKPNKSAKLKAEDITDIVEKKFDRILSSTDYLILVDLGNNSGVEDLAEKYEVSQNYIKQLIRSKDGVEFLKVQAQKKAEISLAISTATVAEGVLKYKALIDECFNNNQEQLGLSYLFGKLSFMEVQQMLSKNQPVEEEKDGLKELFSGLMVK